MDKTKTRILNAATDLFVQKGFSATSISEIATRAGVNKSLIYHHVGSKQDLWKEVKQNLLTPDSPAFEQLSDTFPEFLKSLVKQRVKAYEKDPRILRLMQWQLLEDDKETLIGGTHLAPPEWIEPLITFQKKGQVAQEYPAELIVVYIHSLLNGLLYDPFQIFLKNPKKKAVYLKMIQKLIIDAFSSK